jgi:hypothetical protein
MRASGNIGAAEEKVTFIGFLREVDSLPLGSLQPSTIQFLAATSDQTAVSD